MVVREGNYPFDLTMKLHRDLKIRQSSAWFMAHRIRKSWEQGFQLFNGPVEVDETYIGGKESNKRIEETLRRSWISR